MGRFTSSFVQVASILVFAIVAAEAADPRTPTVETLIEQLGSRSFAEREKATRELRDRGPAALPALRKARDSKDEEVRKRAEAIIPPLEIQEALLPRKVTLKMDGQSAAAALSDLGKQTGYNLAVHDKDDGKKVTADLKAVPFWEAMEKIGRDTDRGPMFQQHDKSLQMISGLGRSPFVNIQGPFRLEAAWFHEDRDVNFTRTRDGKDAPRDHRLTLSVSVLAEPRLTFLNIHPAKVEEATDADGKSLVEPSGGAKADNPPPGRGTFRGMSNYFSDVRLQRASASARSARLIRGTIPVRTILIRRPVVVTSKVLESGGTSFRAGTDSLSIKQVRNQGGGSIEVEVQVPREENGAYREWHDRFSLEDEAGNKFQLNGRGSSSNGREYTISMYFSPPFNKNNVGAPAKLLFEDWVVHEHTIPFEFKDVPLP